MIPRPPRSTRTDTLFPYTTLVRSTRVTPAEAGGTGAGRTLTLDRARPVRVPKTKPPDRGTPRPPPSAACTALRSAPNPYHGNGRHRAKTLERGSDGARALPLSPAAVRQAATGQSAAPGACRRHPLVQGVGRAEACQIN